MDYKRAYGYEKSIYEYYVVGVVASVSYTHLTLPTTERV